MANNSENIEGIKKDVGIIRQRFGSKIKMPNKKTQEEIEEHEVDLMELLLTGMSSAFFDNKGTTENQWSTIFADPKKSLLYSINENIETLSKNLSIERVVGINESFNELISKLEKINNNYEKLIKNTTNNTENNNISSNETINKIIIESNIGDFGSFINYLDNISKTNNINSYRNNIINGLRQLNTILKNPKVEDLITSINVSLSKLFENINDNNNINIDKIFKMISSISDIMNIFSNNKEDINVKNLRDIFIQLGPNGYLRKIIEELYSIYNDKDEINISFSYIKELIESLSLIGDIGPIKRLMIKSNLKYIHDNIIDSINELLNDISTLKEQNKDIYKSLDNISELFETIYKLSGGENLNKVKTKVNLEYIKSVIFPSMLDIINDLIKLGNKVDNEGNIAMDDINKLFEFVFKIGEYNILQLVKFDLKTKYFKDIIISNIKDGIIKELINISEETYNIDNIVNLFDDISKFINILDFIEINSENLNKIKEVGFLFDNINQMPLLSKESLDNFSKFHIILKSYTTNYIQSILQAEIEDVIKNIENMTIASQRLRVLINNIPNDYEYENNFANLKNAIKNIFDIFNSYIDNSWLVDYYSSISDFTKLLDDIDKFIYKLEDLNKHIEKVDFNYLTKFIQNEDLNNFLSEFTTTGNSKTLLDHINKININNETSEKIKSINDVIVSLSTLNKLSKLALLFKIQSLKPYKKLMEQLVDIVNLFKDIKKETIEKAKDSIKSMTIFIGMSAAMLIGGAILFKYASVADIFLFPTVLIGFLIGLTFVFKLLSKISLNKKLIDILDQMVEFVAKCGAILLIGGFIMSIVSVSNIVAFGVILGIFVTMMGVIAVAISSTFENNNNIKALSIFKDYVTDLAKILIIGSLTMALVPWTDIASFIIGLSVFIVAMTAIACGINKWFGKDKKIFDSLNKFKEYVVTCATVMLVGSLMMRIIRMEDIILFTTSLMMFVTLVSLPFLLFKLFKENVFKSANEFALLVAVSATVLMIGSLFAKQDGYFTNSILFAVTLSGFIFLVTLPFILLSKNNLNLLIATALSISLLVAVSGTLLLVAGYIIKNQPSILLAAIGFAVGLAIFLALMGGIIYLLGQVATKASVYILAGLVFIGGIMLLTFASIALIEYIHDKQTDNKLNITAAITTIFGNFKTLIKEIIDLANYIFDFGDGKGKWNWSSGFGSILKGVLGGIGQMGLLSIGIMIVYVLSLTMIIATGSMALVAKALDGINIGLINTKITELFNVYKTILNTYKEEFEFEDIYNAWKVSRVLSELSGAIGKSAQALGLMAQLKFATGYDSKGNPKGYITITSKDFDQVKTNIENVLTVLGNAVVNTAKNHTDIFGDWGLFKDSPAMNAAKVIGVIGRSLIPVAKGIKEWVNLRIPTGFDEKGNPKGYETIKERDFDEASKHIKQVLVCLGKSIIESIGENSDIFKEGIIEDSPAMNAAKAIGIMGNTIRNIAHTILELSTGKFYYLDKDGKPVGNPVEINPDTLKKLGGDGKDKGIIYNLLTALGKAIVDTVKAPENDELFNEGTFTKAPAMVAANSIKAMADSLMTVVDVIKKLNEDPNFNDEKIEGTLGKVKSKIEKIIDCIVESNEEIFNSINGMKGLNFTTDQNNKVNRSGLLAVVDFFTGKKTKVEYVGESVEEMTDTLKSLGDNINAILTITGILTQFSEKLKDKDGNEIDFNSNLQQLAGTGDKSIKKAIDYINDIKDTILQGIKPKIVVNGNNKIDSKEYYKYIENTVGALESCIKSIIKLSEISGSKKNNLGLAAIPGTVGQLLDKLTNKTTELSNFSQLVQDTKEFVQHINALDLNKMSTMQSLIDSLSELSKKFTSLDKFTEVLSEQITAVLHELVLQLRKAEATINNAHELQEHRRKLINDSIKEVKSIMGQHMVVEVYKNDKNNELTFNGGKNYVGNDNGTSRGNTDSKQPTTSSMSSPEDATTEPPKYLKKPTNDNGNNSELLTLDQFKRLMRQNLKDWGNV